MKKVLIPIGFLLVLNLALLACDTNSTGQAISPGDQVFDLADFAEQLFANGVPVELGNKENFGFLPIPALHFNVQGADVLVFEVIGPGTAISIAAAISEDGVTINGQFVPWPATPHFFLEGRIIVLYLGDDPEVLAILEFFLGPQIAGGGSPPPQQPTQPAPAS
jgi:hypothetical protein